MSLNSLDRACPNCAAKLHGQYCANCGQNQKGLDRYFWSLVNEAFEGVFSLNSKAWLTTFYLWFKPGRLSEDHFQNRRARYVSPLRLYLITSVAYFLILSLQANLSITVSERVVPAEKTSQKPTQVSGTEGIDEESVYLDLDLDVDPKVTINLPFVGEQRERLISAALHRKINDAKKLMEERPKIIIGKLIDSSPVAIFILLPLFALVLKLFHLKRNYYYSQHLVFAVHNHSFVFAALSVITVISWFPATFVAEGIQRLLLFWLIIYMPIALRRVFNESWPWTLFKTAMLFLIYLMFFGLAMAFTAMLGVILL